VHDEPKRFVSFPPKVVVKSHVAEERLESLNDKLSFPRIRHGGQRNM
jgi:hypothetical protein